MTFTLQIGLPRMHKEPGERRDFLPDFVGRLARRGAEIYLEHGYGSGMGISADEYQQKGGTAVSPVRS
jgi:alanine dehydrogenase